MEKITAFICIFLVAMLVVDQAYARPGKRGEGRPGGGRPGGGRPGGGRPGGGRPGEGRPSGGRPSGGRPSGGRPSGGKPDGKPDDNEEKPEGDKPEGVFIYGEKPEGGEQLGKPERPEKPERPGRPERPGKPHKPGNGHFKPPHRGMKPRVCYMKYTNMTDGVKGEFKLSSCGANFNCEDIHVSQKNMSDLNVTVIYMCKPEIDCNNMECLPTEVCLPPTEKSDEEFKPEGPGFNGEEDEESESDEESNEESDEEVEVTFEKSRKLDESRKPSKGKFRPKPHKFARCVPKKMLDRVKPNTV